MAFSTLLVLILSPDYRLGVYGCGFWYAAVLLYSWPAGRKRLVYMHEEEFAEL